MLKNIKEWTWLLDMFGFTSLFGNCEGYDILSLREVLCRMILVLIVLDVFILRELIPFNFQSIAYISIIGVIVSMRWMPGEIKVAEWTNEVELLVLATPILAYAGIAMVR